jgi:hypothetical protein
MRNSRKIRLILTRLRDVYKTPCGLVFLNSKFIMEIILEMSSMIKLLTCSVRMLKEKILKNILKKLSVWTLLFFTHLNKEGNMMGP